VEDEMDNGPGWLPDPEHEGQERYWDGSDWTAQVRPAGSLGSLHLPEHVPELQRALAAATADIDQVEDRLSSMFDRGSPTGAGAVHRRGAVVADDDVDGVDADAGDEVDSAVGVDSDVDEDEDEDEDDGWADEDEFALHEEFEDEDLVDEVKAADKVEEVDEVDAEDDDDAMAELDAALAAEAPEKPERRLFRRKS